MSEDEKFYALVHAGGPGGVLRRKPRMRKQDKRAQSAEMYAVVFFPKITGIGKAMIWPNDIAQTLANTPETAIARFMDKIAKSETWETYHDAGHRVRKVKVMDLGDA